MITQVRWRQIAGDLRDQIARGQLRPGDPLPSEAVLAQRYDVARMTARNALLDLERAGVALPGRPRRVAHHEPLAVHIAREAGSAHGGQAPTAGADDWLGDMRAAGHDPAQRIDVLSQLADAQLATRLKVGEGSAVVARRIIRLAGDRPHNLITWWFPAGVAQGTPLAGPADIIEGSVAWLEAAAGQLVHDVEVTARQPGEDETTALAIPPGVPVLVVWRTSRTLAGAPVVTSMAVYPADRTRLLIEP
jgi:GntR family transcriptional regulator